MAVATSDPRHGRDLRVARPAEIEAGVRRLTEITHSAPVGAASYQFALRCLYAAERETARREQIR